MPDATVTETSESISQASGRVTIPGPTALITNTGTAVIRVKDKPLQPGESITVIADPDGKISVMGDGTLSYVISGPSPAVVTAAAAGADLAGATALLGGKSYVLTSDSSAKGWSLPALHDGSTAIYLFVSGATGGKLYPASSSVSLNNGTAGASMDLTGNTLYLVVPLSTTLLAVK